MPARRLSKLLKSILFFSILSLNCWGDPLTNSIQVGQSTSKSYEAANVFLNPAALAFNTILNGSGPYTAYGHSFNRNGKNASTFALTWGYFGFGYERLAITTQSYSRFSVALGVPLDSIFYLGSRIRITRSDLSAVGSPDALDLGLQVRAYPWLSIGLMANDLNQPTINGAELPVQFVMSATVRPWHWLEVTGDVDTYSNGLFNTIGYQVTASTEPFRGMRVSAGYHDVYQWQLGLEISFGRTAVQTVLQPNTDNRNIVLNMRTSVLPRRSSVEFPSALEVTIDSALQAEPVEGSLFLPSQKSLYDVLETLQDAKADPDIRSVVVNIENFPLGLEAAHEINESLWALRKQGISIEVFLKDAGMAEYVIASAANKIHLSPVGNIKFTGPSFQKLFWKGTLDKIGIEAEVFAKGKYKSAPESFTQKQSSAHVRQANLEALSALESNIVELISKSKRIDGPKWKKLRNMGLVAARSAKALGIVDELATYDSEQDRIKSKQYIIDSIGRHKDRLNLPYKVALIHASGNIVQNSKGIVSISGVPLVTPKSMEQKLERALRNPLVKSIVLRVDSGGGEVGASHDIATLVSNARKRKPVIVSMGSAAASGGYMIAAAGDTILAEPSTLTGSIGVFLGKPNIQGLMRKIDLNSEIVSHAPQAALFAMTRPYTNEGKRIMLKQLDEYYSGFVGYVAEQRKLSTQEVETAAQGRIWFGNSALKYKLIDKMGGYHDAIELAATKAGIDGDYEVLTIAQSRSLLDLVGPSAWISTATEEHSPWSVFSLEERKQIFWMARLKTEPFLLLTPVHLSE